MQILKKNKFIFLFILLLALLLAGSFLFFEKYKSNKLNEINTNSEEIISDKDEVEVEILREENSNSTSVNEAIESVLENDAENLNVNEEPEKTAIANEDSAAKKQKFTMLPLNRKVDPDVLRIGFMTDLHVQSIDGKGNSLAAYYSDKMNYFVEKMNNDFIPSFILLNGDVIEGTRTSSEIGIKELSLVKEIFNRTRIKKYWVAGNHDLRSVNKKQWMNALDIDYMSKAFDVGNYKVIILDGNYTKEDLDVKPGTSYLRGKVSQKQVEWLRKELEKTNKKVIVFMHYPPLRDIAAKNNLRLLYNARELQEIFSQYGVLAVFSGHIEDLYYQEIGGVDYFVSPGMVKYPNYKGAFSEITINGKKISINFNYLLENGEYRSVKIEKQ